MTRSKRGLRAILELNAPVQGAQILVPEFRNNMATTIVINDDEDDVHISSPRSFAQAKSSLNTSRQRFRTTMEPQRGRAMNADLELRLGLPSDDLLPLGKVQQPSRPTGTVVPRDPPQGPQGLTIDLTIPTFDADCIFVNKFVQKKRKPPVPAQPPRHEAAKEIKLTCAICMDTMKEETSTVCGHIFCARCIDAAIRSQKRCPTCRRKLNQNNTHRIYLSGSLR